MKIAKERSYSSINIGDVEEFQRRVTIEDIDKFTELSGDNNPLHNDEDYAKTTTFGSRIAHGMLVSSYFSTLVGMYLPGKDCLYLSQNLLFKLPIKPGGDLTIKGTVINKIDALKIIIVRTQIINEGGQVLIDGEAKVKHLGLN